MPLSKTTYPFPIDGALRPIFTGREPSHWEDAATQKGFSLIGRAVDGGHVVIGCQTCSTPTMKRMNVVSGHKPKCPNCTERRRKAAAGTIGAKLIGEDPEGNSHYGHFELACGHTDRRQYSRIEAAAAGGHNAGCPICLEDRNAADAERQGWELVGPALRPNPGYRRYEHDCGQHQDVAVVNMLNGDVDCAGCGETWASKPSKIYILNFTLPKLPVIKLGYSNNPEFRVRQVQKDPKRTRGSVARKIAIETGHRAVGVEKALHTHIRRHRPDLIVPPELFRDHIRTTSEIYHRHGKPYLEALLDAVDSGWDPSMSGAPTELCSARAA